MIDDLSTYSVENFIPFQSESYFRQFERQTEVLWPLPLVLLALGIAAIVLAWRSHIRAAATLMATALVASSLAFHFWLYAKLTPVGSVFGIIFLVQAAFVLAWGFLSRPVTLAKPDLGKWSGLALAVFGVAVHPVLVRFAGENGGPAEWFGLAPDPTVCVMLGLVLMLARPLWLLLLLPLPLLWCLISGATLGVIEAPLSALPYAVAALALLAAIVTTVVRRKTAPPAGASCPPPDQPE